MQPSENLTEKNQLKLNNTDEQVTNVNHPTDASAVLHKLIYIYQLNNTSEANHAQKNLENSSQCQAERIVLFDHVLSTNSIQHAHKGFMYRKEDFQMNLFMFVIVLLITLALVYQAFRFDLTQ